MICPKDEIERRLLLASYSERVEQEAPLPRGSDRGDDGFSARHRAGPEIVCAGENAMTLRQPRSGYFV